MIDTTGRSYAEALRAEAAAFERSCAAEKRRLADGVRLAEAVARLVERHGAVWVADRVELLDEER